MLDIINYSNSDIVCSCGQIHKKSTQTIVWGSNAIDKVFCTINMFLTAGQILLIYDKKSDEQIINKIKSGFEGTNLIIKTYEAEPKEDNYKISEMEKIIFNEEDDIKIIIAYGDDKISRFARFTANMKNINYVMIPSTIGIDYLKKNSFFVIKGVLTNCQLKAPIALIVDTDLLKNTQTQYLAKAYSYIVSAKITLAEYYFQGLKSQSFCSCLSKEINNEIDKFIDFNYNANNEFYAEKVLELLMKISLTESMLSIEDCNIIEIYNILICLSRIYKDNSHNFIMTSTLINHIYKTYLKNNCQDIIYPSDRINCIKMLSKIADMDYNHYIREAKLVSIEEMVYARFIINEFNNDINSRLLTDEQMNKIAIAYRRFLPDAGYNMSNTINSESLVKLLGLVGELAHSSTLLNYMKINGYLEIKRT
jgi:hypothetical protein